MFIGQVGNDDLPLLQRVANQDLGAVFTVLSGEEETWEELQFVLKERESAAFIPSWQSPGGKGSSSAHLASKESMPEVRWSADCSTRRRAVVGTMDASRHPGGHSDVSTANHQHHGYLRMR